MSFISFEFVLFFSIVIPVYFATPIRVRWLLLLVASYFFYAYWNVSYIILIIFSTLVDYVAARVIGDTPKENRRKRLLFLSMSLAVNLGVLFIFKYYNWFSASLNDGLSVLGFDLNLTSLQVLLPVGISFYTFQSMSYTIDVYRGQIKPEKHAGIFATYVALFPQLVAGPIERASNIIPQLKVNYVFDPVRTTEGFRLILWGVFKKVVIADRVAVYVNAVYNNPTEYSGITLIIATLFFAFQIYCDFSGYSDIAIGVARIMGIDLMQNFRQPYLSRSIREFWRRWHISLSTWFRDYLYIPLGGNRVSFARNLLNLMIVFVVSGLWHGANWTFVIWGALHGIFIVIEVILSTVRKRNGEIHQPNFTSTLASWLVTFVLVCVAWIFFRANSVEDAFYILGNLFNFNVISPSILAPFEPAVLPAATEFLISLMVIGILIIGDFVDTQSSILRFLNHRRLPVRWGIYYALIGVVLFTLTFSGASETFIYFQF